MATATVPVLVLQPKRKHVRVNPVGMTERGRKLAKAATIQLADGPGEWIPQNSNIGRESCGLQTKVTKSVVAAWRKATAQELIQETSFALSLFCNGIRPAADTTMLPTIKEQPKAPRPIGCETPPAYLGTTREYLRIEPQPKQQPAERQRGKESWSRPKPATWSR